jgi:hypothetical protein
VVAEAVRVPGAAAIWFPRNHPSGTAQLSPADRMIHRTLIDAFNGSGIEPMDLIAVAGRRFADKDGPADIPSSTASVTVPVIEREIDTSFNPMLALALSSPGVAKQMAASVYGRGQGPGLMLMDAQNRYVAWVPLDAKLAAQLRGTGGLGAVYRAISQANAAGAILVHGGECLGAHERNSAFRQHRRGAEAGGRRSAAGRNRCRRPRTVQNRRPNTASPLPTDRFTPAAASRRPTA